MTRPSQEDISCHPTVKELTLRKKNFKSMDLNSVILVGSVIGTSIILILVMAIIWRYIMTLTVKTQMEDQENKMVSVQVLQSPVKLHESVMVLAEEGLYQDCVTSTPHVNRSHSYTSDVRSHSYTSDDTYESSSSDTKSVNTLCRSQVFGSTYIIDKVEESTCISEEGAEEDKSPQHQTFTVCNLDQRLEEALQNENTFLLENAIGEKDMIIIAINEEEENSDEESNSCDENENFILREKYLVHRTVSESMINITFE